MWSSAPSSDSDETEPVGGKGAAEPGPSEAVAPGPPAASAASATVRSAASDTPGGSDTLEESLAQMTLTSKLRCKRANECGASSLLRSAYLPASLLLLLLSV